MQDKGECYIYCRVSTEEQAEGGFSLDNQKRACVDYATSNQYHIKEIFVDEARSARSTDRPEFQRMMKGIRKEPVDAIIFYKIDRLARNIGDFAAVRKEFLNYGN